jgi:hypothetical protein
MSTHLVLGATKEQISSHFVPGPRHNEPPRLDLIEEWIQKIAGLVWVSLQSPPTTLARNHSSEKTLSGSYSTSTVVPLLWVPKNSKLLLRKRW